MTLSKAYEHIKIDYNVIINEKMAYKALEEVRERLIGNEKAQYREHSNRENRRVRAHRNSKLAIDIFAAASAVMAVIRVHLLSASAIKLLRSSQGIFFINAFPDLIATPKPLRSRERTSSVNSPPPMTLVFTIGILSLVYALLSTRSQFLKEKALMNYIYFLSDFDSAKSFPFLQMSAGGAFGGNRGLRPVPPEKGIFPLDHMYLCDLGLLEKVLTVPNGKGHCGSCWAFGAVESLLDRFCIHFDVNISLSVNDLLAGCGFLCGSGCDGGYPLNGWQYLVSHGVVTKEVLNQLVKEHPTMALTVGTVLRVEDAKAVINAGAKFLMSPAIVKFSWSRCRLP
ncbi:uncharacterized protein DS421_5g145380 [Arachis hypogaea]|nr:uncharacterized protein DS421_5g145380 [Arachis hypogaea]